MALLSRASKSDKAASGRAGGRGSAAGKKPKRPRGARLKQLRTAFTLTKQSDPRLVPLLLAAFLGPFVLLLAIGLVLDEAFLLGVLGFLVGLLVTTIDRKSVV